MKRVVAGISFISLLCLMALGCGKGGKEEGGPVASQEEEPKATAPPAFFNGKDLTGWKGLEEYWSVEDEAIVGSTHPDGLKFNTFLCSAKQYGDFELKFRVKMEGPQANSGVQVRSEIFDEEKLAVKGPQCDMGQIYWGSLYGEHFGGMMQKSDEAIVTKVLKDQEFNDYYIRCEGKHITIKLNGETTVDADFEKAPDNGIIAFQVHAGPAMKVTFKDIEFKEIKQPAEQAASETRAETAG